MISNLLVEATEDLLKVDTFDNFSSQLNTVCNLQFTRRKRTIYKDVAFKFL